MATILTKEFDEDGAVLSGGESTTKMADRIFMLEKGRVIEQGSHQELLNLGGKYAQMFLLQSEKYVLNS